MLALRTTRATTEAVTEAEETTAKVANHVLKELKSNSITL
jgi:AICAR transformylase/IMP cyclohydrolase PurH